MRLFSFEPNRGRPLTSWVDVQGVKHRVDPKTSKVVIAPVFASQSPSRLACFHIGPGGFLPRHPATGPQLFAVVAGAGWVSGDGGGKTPIKAGQAAYWAAGEAHESGTDKGMTVIVVECEQYDPAQFMGELR
ncbi:MAG TPA: cupin [Actinomycetota bacterium]|jgi:quercetin dioxygenase-like cupin family protein|nr:cupin [Actinomycetota bacterium]